MKNYINTINWELSKDNKLSAFILKAIHASNIIFTLNVCQYFVIIAVDFITKTFFPADLM